MVLIEYIGQLRARSTLPDPRHITAADGRTSIPIKGPWTPDHNAMPSSSGAGHSRTSSCDGGKFHEVWPSPSHACHFAIPRSCLSLRSQATADEPEAELRAPPEPANTR